MVKIHSPGPRYNLPSTTGFINHDPTRTQAPAFSFGVSATGIKARGKAPGPKYDVRGLTEHGKLTTQQAVVLGRWTTSKMNRTPAPKSYDTSVTQPTAPAYSIAHKRADMRRSKLGPGPNKYIMPTCIGPIIPDKRAEPAYSILSRNFTVSKRQAPGPKYMLPDNNVYLKTPPRVAMLGRSNQKFNKGVPGPNKYTPIPTYEKQEGMKGISFGVKHSPEKHLALMPEDRVQEAFVF